MTIGRSIYAFTVYTFYRRWKELRTRVGVNMDWTGLPASVIGGVLGALAGGIPAWLLARRESSITLQRDNDERQRQEKSLAFAVHVKLATIMDSTLHDWSHVERSLAELERPETAHMEPWQILQPLTGDTDEGIVRFTPEELAIFLAAGAKDLMHDMMLLAQRHSASVSAMRAYRTERERLIERSPVPEVVDGVMGKGWVTAEELKMLRPHSAALNALVAQIAEALKKNVELCKTVAEAIGPTVQSYFGDPKFGGLTFPTEVELAKMISEPEDDGVLPTSR